MNNKTFSIKDKDKRFIVDVGQHAMYSIPSVSLQVNRPNDDVSFSSMADMILNHIYEREALNNSNIDSFTIKSGILPGVEIFIILNNKDIATYEDDLRCTLLYVLILMQSQTNSSANTTDEDVSTFNRYIQKLQGGMLSLSS